MQHLRVWYIDRVPAKKFTYIDVNNVEEAIIIINALSKRDLNDERITDNAMGLEEKEEETGEWCEYYNDEGEDINEIMNNL